MGYSRAVRVGNVVEVAGTTAQDGDTVTGADAYTQARRVLEKIGEALVAAGVSFGEVVRTRMFVQYSLKAGQFRRASLARL